MRSILHLTGGAVLRTVRRIPLTAIVLMTVVSLLNVLGVRLAGMSVVIGVLFFFLTSSLEKQSVVNTGLDLKGTRIVLENPAIWLWMALPLVMNGVCLTVSRIFFQFSEARVIDRPFCPFGEVLLYWFAVLAIGRNCWRFFRSS